MERTSGSCATHSFTSYLLVALLLATTSCDSGTEREASTAAPEGPAATSPPSLDLPPAPVSAAIPEGARFESPGTEEERFLRRVKNAVALVKYGVDVGSGFGLTRTRVGYLVVTSADLVPDRQLEAEVTFSPGTPKARTLSAKLLAGGPPHSLSVLVIEDAPWDLDVLDVAPEGEDEVVETQPVLIPGYPLVGASPHVRTSTPDEQKAITLTHGRISSLRHTSEGILDAVQLDADVNPGNSGSPVIDEYGLVIGVAFGTLATTDISFMVPAAEIRHFLDGFVSQVIVKSECPPRAWRDLFRKKTRIEAIFTMEDPVGRITKVGLNVLPKGHEPDEGVRVWPFELVGDELVSAESADFETVATVELFGSGEIWIQPWFENREARLPLEPYKVSLGGADSLSVSGTFGAHRQTLQTEDDAFMASVREANRQRNELPPPPEPSWEDGDWLGTPPPGRTKADAGEPTPSVVPSADVGQVKLAFLDYQDLVALPVVPSGIEKELVPQAGQGRLETSEGWFETERDAADGPRFEVLDIPREGLVQPLIWSADGQSVYLLGKNGLLRIVSMPDLTERRRLDFGAPVTDLALAKDRLLVLVSAVQEVVVLDPRTLEPEWVLAAPGASEITAVPTSSLAFFVAPGDRSLSVVDLGARQTVARISGIVHEWSPWVQAFSRRPIINEFSNLSMTPDGRYLYFVSSSRVHRIDLTGRQLRHDGTSPDDPSYSRNFTVSPDARYVGAAGTKTKIYKTDNLWTPVVTMTASTCRGMGFLPRTARVVLACSGTLGVYDSEGEEVRVVNSPTRGPGGGPTYGYLTAVYPSPSGRGLWVVAEEALLWVPELTGGNEP